MIDLDDLKNRWADYDRKLDENLRLNRRILNTLVLGRARTALQRMAAIQAVGAVISVVCIVALGSFIFENRTQLRFSLPACALDLLAIGSLISLIRQISGALQIDRGGAVAAIQKQFEELRRIRIRYIQFALLGGMLAWTPFVIVFIKAIFGGDAYKAFGSGWLAANLAFTIAADLVALWIARKYVDRLDQTPFLQRLVRDATGYNFNRAASFVSELSDFERE